MSVVQGNSLKTIAATLKLAEPENRFASAAA